MRARANFDWRHQRLANETEALASLDATITSSPYQQIIAVFTGAISGIRAKDVCLALDTDSSPQGVERMRARLKRLVTRQVLAEPEPGLFALASVDHPANTTREQSA